MVDTPAGTNHEPVGCRRSQCDADARGKVVVVAVEARAGHPALPELDDLAAVGIKDRSGILSVECWLVILVAQAQCQGQCARHSQGAGSECAGRACSRSLESFASRPERVTWQAEEQVGQCILRVGPIRKVEVASGQDVTESVLAYAALLEAKLQQVTPARIAERVRELPSMHGADLGVVELPAKRREASDLEEAQA